MLKLGIFIVLLFWTLVLVFAQLHPVLEQVQQQVAQEETRERLQATLTRVATNAEMIQSALDETLPRIPGASRIRIGVIRLRTDGGLQFDALFGAALPNHDVGPLSNDRPHSVWFNFLPDLVKGQCVMIHTRDCPPEYRARLELPVAAFMRCPVTDGEHLLGAVSVSWDDENDVPTDLATVETTMRALAVEVGKRLP